MHGKMTNFIAQPRQGKMINKFLEYKKNIFLLFESTKIQLLQIDLQSDKNV